MYFGVMVLVFVMDKVVVKMLVKVVGVLVVEVKVLNCFDFISEYLIKLFYVVKLVVEGLFFGVIIVKED